MFLSSLFVVRNFFCSFLCTRKIVVVILLFPLEIFHEFVQNWSLVDVIKLCKMMKTKVVNVRRHGLNSYENYVMTSMELNLHTLSLLIHVAFPMMNSGGLLLIVTHSKTHETHIRLPLTVSLSHTHSSIWF